MGENTELHNNLEHSNTLSYYALKNMWGLLILLKMTGFIYRMKSTVCPGSIYCVILSTSCYSVHMASSWLGRHRRQKEAFKILCPFSHL